MKNKEYNSRDKYGEYKVLIIDKEYAILKGSWAVINLSLFGSYTNSLGILNELTKRGYEYKLKKWHGLYFLKDSQEKG